MRQANAHERPARMHFIREWAEKKGRKQKDFLERIDVNKSTVSRWFAGDMPSGERLVEIADFLGVDVPSLFRHPDDDWLSEFFRRRSAAEKERAIRILRATFDDPPDDGIAD